MEFGARRTERDEEMYFLHAVEFCQVVHTPSAYLGIRIRMQRKNSTLSFQTYLCLTFLVLERQS